MLFDLEYIFSFKAENYFFSIIESAFYSSALKNC